MMDGFEGKTPQNPPPERSQRLSSAAQIFLRLSAAAASLAAAWVMFTAKQSAVIYGMPLEAKYSYSSAFMFFAIANVVACVFSVISLLVAVVLQRSRFVPNNYYYMFIHDLLMTTLVMAACAAATAIGYVGKYGNVHSGWMAVCHHFARFCDRITASIILSYFAFVFYFFLTIASASKSRKVLQASS
ncbi:CASP-like protein 1F1 [Diospyros lotus]|uniref:CASP-like protein 1F1 n=1 Tax=Diospyros lotus TaxID=55363 RepID=UPI00225331BE|nr:CASP-like protein 1F1 [Diospyros lotus]